VVVAVPLLNACGTAAGTAPTAAPAAPPTVAPKPTTAPAAGAPTTAPAAAATPAGAAPTTAPTTAPASNAPAPTATDVPVTRALPPPTKSSAKITGKWIVLLNQDFNPEHTAYLKKGILDYAQFQGWPIDFSFFAGFSAGGDALQKLAAQVSAGQPVDLVINDLSGFKQKFLGILEDMDDITKEMLQKYGDTIPGMKKDRLIDGKWWATPQFTRTGGRWGRRDIFTAASIDVDKDLLDLKQLPDQLLKVSAPDKQMWGWGMTMNTSGDGETLVQDTLMAWGSRLTEETGQLVKLNSPATVEAVTWLTDIYMNAKWKNMLPPGVNSWTDPSNNEAWLANHIAYTSNAGTLYGQTVQQNKPFAKDSLLLRVPGLNGKPGLQGAGGSAFWTYKGTKNKEATYDLIKYLLDPVSQKALCLTTPGYVAPAYKNLWSDADIRKDQNIVRFEPIAWDEAAYNGIAFPGPNTAAASAVADANIYTKLTAAVLNGKKPEDAVKEAHANAIKVYKDFGAKGE
jgi:multiple sugar transport system substrate-binding protein